MFHKKRVKEAQWSGLQKIVQTISFVWKELIGFHYYPSKFIEFHLLWKIATIWTHKCLQSKKLLFMIFWTILDHPDHCAFSAASSLLKNVWRPSSRELNDFTLYFCNNEPSKNKHFLILLSSLASQSSQTWAELAVLFSRQILNPLF